MGLRSIPPGAGRRQRRVRWARWLRQAPRGPETVWRPRIPATGATQSPRVPAGPRGLREASPKAARTASLLLQLWIPPAFGCRPEYDNGLEEIVFGFEPWIIAVNLAMPFSIFYRMHAAASLFEVYCKI